jgi:hypothetical protein
VRSQPYATSRSSQTPAWREVRRREHLGIVVVQQFAPQPIEHAATESAGPFTIYRLGVETPNERNESS